MFPECELSKDIKNTLPATNRFANAYCYTIWTLFTFYILMFFEWKGKTKSMYVVIYVNWFQIKYRSWRWNFEFVYIINSFDWIIFLMVSCLHNNCICHLLCIIFVLFIGTIPTICNTRIFITIIFQFKILFSTCPMSINTVKN